MGILNIKDLSYSYETNEALHNFNLEVEEGSWVSIVGPNGSGKSTLVHVLAGLIKHKGEVIVDGTRLTEHNAMLIRSKIGFIFDNPDDMFVGELVRDDLAFGLENLNISKSEIARRIDQVAKLFKIESLLDIPPERLSGGEKQKIALASVLAMNAKILVLDDALSMIDPLEQREIMKILVSLHESTNLTIITIAADLEDVLYADKLVVMDSGVKVIEGPTMDVLCEEKIFMELGMRLPFMVDLSLKLKDYQLVDGVILDMKEMVNKLWQ